MKAARINSNGVEAWNVAVETAAHGAYYDNTAASVSYTHLRAHETVLDLVCRLLLEKKTQKTTIQDMGRLTVPYHEDRKMEEVTRV